MCEQKQPLPMPSGLNRVILSDSLSDYMSHNHSRVKLEETLTPSHRKIKFMKVEESRSIKLEIDILLSLTRNAIEQQDEHFVLHVGGQGKTGKTILCCPYYGFEKMKGPPIKQIAVLLNLLKCISMKIKTHDLCTVRDVFYLNVELYQNQKIVATWLRNIVDAFELPQLDALGIVAAQKGLFCTPVELRFDFNKLIARQQSSLVPLIAASTELEADWSGLERVIVFEKDAIFSKVADHPSISERCMLVTGKGYPDWLTRHFLYKLMLFCPDRVFFEVYTDSDPYGIDIALKYIHNDIKATYQCPRLNYRGVLMHEVIANKDSPAGLRLLNLSSRDFAYAKNLLRKLNDVPIRTRNKKTLIQELQRQMFYFKKAEMNTINGSNFCDYFLIKIGETTSQKR
ncbi:LADA_0E12684g1_1 [Lachancea dasiensis]|uniref:DNA topoisomerase (ATP-hydrolyzing) n=1 Tax=Lachancea dasiensis TaxID=1072105 RepID=A0A1G4JF64_9SACH|nr:LADA_0E12684g1_1 [Lachancea dasiensis]